jgi:hypothetical protein
MSDYITLNCTSQVSNLLIYPHGAPTGGIIIPYDTLALLSQHRNSRPVTYDHPVDTNGDYCLLGELDPAERDQFIIGDSLDFGLNEDGTMTGKLRIDRELLAKFDIDLLNSLDKGNPSSVSEGFLGYATTIDENLPSVMTLIIVDHIALLPLGTIGACNQPSCKVQILSE